MRSRKEFDAESDPPPDLAIEVDITRFLGLSDQLGERELLTAFLDRGRS